MVETKMWRSHETVGCGVIFFKEVGIGTDRVGNPNEVPQGLAYGLPGWENE